MKNLIIQHTLDPQTSHKSLKVQSSVRVLWKYIEKYPSSRKYLVFWNKEENCGNDTELGHELFDYIDCTLEQKGEVLGAKKKG